MQKPIRLLQHAVKHMVLLCSLLFFTSPFVALGQTYSRNDSIHIYQWLDQADQETVTGSLNAAMQSVEKALWLSKQKKMQRGEALGALKMADIMMQKDSMHGVPDLLETAITIGMQLKDSFIIALGTYQHGQYLMYDDQYDKAEKLFNKALSLRFEKDQSIYTAVVYNDMGYLFDAQDELAKAVFWYLKAVRIYEKENYIAGLAMSTNNLGSVYARLNNTDKAIEYVRKAIVMRERAGDTKGLAISNENLSRLYWNISLDSASKYQQIAMKYAEKTGLTSLMIKSYDNLSVLMDKRRNKQEALTYIRKSITLCRQLDDKVGLANKYRWAALLCGDLKDMAAAEDYFRQSYDISVQLNNKTLMRDYYGTKASYYRKANDFKNAFENLKLYYTYRDSIIKNETEQNVAELQTRYETEKKDNEIARLSADQRIGMLEIEKQKAIIAGNLLETRQKENEIKLLSQEKELQDARLSRQSEELERQRLVAKNNQQELKLAAQEKQLNEKQLQDQKLYRNFLVACIAVLLLAAGLLFNRYQLRKKIEQQKVLLEMRNNISRNLHDDIGASLSNIHILNELTKRNVADPDKANNYLSKAGDDIQRISESLSDIVWNINPQYDALDNLFIRMKRYAADMMDGKNIEAQLVFPAEGDKMTMPMDQRRDFYLIFKEAVNNLVKYSKASVARVEVISDEHNIHLLVADNGSGFDPGNTRPGNGIQNMKQRADKWKACLQVQSAPGSGTTISLDMKIAS